MKKTILVLIFTNVLFGCEQLKKKQTRYKVQLFEVNSGISTKAFSYVDVPSDFSNNYHKGDTLCVGPATNDAGVDQGYFLIIRNSSVRAILLEDPKK
jgi:hypothetical protein